MTSGEIFLAIEARCDRSLSSPDALTATRALKVRVNCKRSAPKIATRRETFFHAGFGSCHLLPVLRLFTNTSFLVLQIPTAVMNVVQNQPQCLSLMFGPKAKDGCNSSFASDAAQGKRRACGTRPPTRGEIPYARPYRTVKSCAPAKFQNCAAIELRAESS